MFDVVIRQLLSARSEVGGFLPQGDSTQQSIQVRDDGDIARDAPDIHLHGIATTDIETVVVKHFFKLGDDLQQAIVPQFFADAFELGATQPILSDFQIRDEAAIDEQGGSDARSQG